MLGSRVQVFGGVVGLLLGTELAKGFGDARVEGRGLGVPLLLGRQESPEPWPRGKVASSLQNHLSQLTPLRFWWVWRRSLWILGFGALGTLRHGGFEAQAAIVYLLHCYVL